MTAAEKSATVALEIPSAYSINTPRKWLNSKDIDDNSVWQFFDEEMLGSHI